MNRKISLKRRTLHVFCVGAFVLALAGKAFGWGGCPQHDALPTPPTANVPSAAVHAVVYDANEVQPVPVRAASVTDHESLGGTGPLTAHEHDGPCTCVGCCHDTLRAAEPTIGSAVALPWEAIPVAGLSSHASGVRRPRHEPFELPLPNAPPVLL